MSPASSYEVTTLRPRAAVGRHQGVRPTSHSQGTFGSRGRRVRPVRGVAHSHSQGYSQRGRGVLGSSYPGSCIAPVLWGQKAPIAPVLSILVTTRCSGGV